MYVYMYACVYLEIFTNMITHIRLHIYTYRTLISLEGATDLLRPYLGEIINEYFRIMEEVENDAVLSALQVGSRFDKREE